MSARHQNTLHDEELLQLVRETVVQLNILGDRLEHYAEARMPPTREGEGEGNAGTVAGGSERAD